MFVCHGVALRGWAKGDAFVAGAIGASVALVALFTLYPISRLFVRALLDRDGNYSLAALTARLVSSRIWGIRRRGVEHAAARPDDRGRGDAAGAVLRAHRHAEPRFPDAASVGVLRRAADDHAAVRHRPRAHHAVRPLGRRRTRCSNGRSGSVRRAGSTDCPACGSRRRWRSRPSRIWCWSASSTGISPSLEEAAQTLRASPWTTFTTVTLPLLAPGLVNAFLIVFIESLADFGNPLLLGGNLEVLSVAIYFAIVGVQQDPGPRGDPRDRAARACRSRCSSCSGGSSRGAASSRFPARGGALRLPLPRVATGVAARSRRCRGSRSPSSSTR